MKIHTPENMDENILKTLIGRFGGEENIPNAYRILAGGWSLYSTGCFS